MITVCDDDDKGDDDEGFVSVSGCWLSSSLSARSSSIFVHLFDCDDGDDDDDADEPPVTEEKRRENRPLINDGLFSESFCGFLIKIKIQKRKGKKREKGKKRKRIVQKKTEQ